jgi:acetyltransferase-like isoleucine patch superfamily enzyme
MNDILQRLYRKVAYWIPGGSSIRPLLHRKRGVIIGQNVWISQYVYIDEIHPELISIGDNVSIGIGVIIIAHFYWGPKRKNQNSHVTIGNDVFIGPNCVILPNVTIGNQAVIQAGTVVSRDVPSNTLWGLPGAKAIARVTVPLTYDQGFSAFKKGLRPISKIETLSSSDEMDGSNYGSS